MNVVKEISTINAQVLADFILASKGPMSHLKLQKLLYYCEAYHLAYFEVSLISETFEAWVHGPVCKDVFDSLTNKSLLHSDIGFNGTYDPISMVREALATEQFSLVSEVINHLSNWTGIQLESSTHSELPWIEARVGLSAGDKSSRIISKQTMKEFYKQELNGEN
jgi:uncharacterized phage-associated protein